MDALTAVIETHALCAGADAFLVKGCPAEELLAAILANTVRPAEGGSASELSGNDSGGGLGDK